MADLVIWCNLMVLQFDSKGFETEIEKVEYGKEDGGRCRAVEFVIGVDTVVDLSGEGGIP